ncbi:MAG: PIN domain-containing protein [Kiloniellales bacterium]|nr:PIN domain-containing protein [Kiloniellales bacterium]
MVLDTDVLVAAMRSPKGASAALLRELDSGNGTLLLNVALALEYEATCQLTEHRLAAGLSVGETDSFLNGVIAMAEPVERSFFWRPQLRDPGDEMVLEAAVNGRAQALVTFNRRDYGTAAQRFGIEILLPADALRRIRE